MHPPWPEFEALAARTVEHVIPRLLNALGAVKPSLIHGDLWAGNIGSNTSTGEILLFDAGAYYAHRELDIGVWRCDYLCGFGEEFRRMYCQGAGVDEPKHEWEDRNRLYGTYFDVLCSVNEGPVWKAGRQS